MAGYVEDRWYRKGPADPETGKPTREKTARHGKGKRWRVAGIPGVRDRSFKNLEGEHGAKGWLKTAATDTSRGAFYDPRDGEMTLDEYVRVHWWPHLRTPPTTKASMKPRVFKHIVPHVGHLSLNRIGFDEVKAWQTRAEQDVDVGTLIAAWSVFSSIMQAAYKAKRVPTNPFRDPDLVGPKPPKSKAQAWPEETVAAVREALLPRYRILLDEALGAGLRQGEAFGLSPDDVDGEDIHVVRQVILVGGKLAFAPPKGNKERDAPCPPELAQAIKEHANLFPTVAVTLPWVDPDRPNLDWNARPKRTVRLLATTSHTGGISGGALNRSMFDDKHWKPALVRAGVIPKPKVELVQGKGKQPWRRVKWEMPREDGFHVLRHTFASIVLAESETIGQLAVWLGHSDPAFTLRTYVHFMPKSGRRGVAALGRWLSRAADSVSEAEPGDAGGLTVPDLPRFSPEG